MYQKIKRLLDFILAFILLVIFAIPMAIIAIAIKADDGGTVLYKQPRMGKNLTPFYIYKFRTMTDKKDEKGKLLPDEQRLTRFGKILRSTSLDELPELLNILKGDMAIVGPRPQLIKDMIFMTTEQRKRHTVRPGLTGLAQVNGRNNLTWEEKINYDLKYINKITFFEDCKIILKTIIKVFKREDIETEGMETAEDLCDYLLRTNKISEEEYDKKMELMGR